MAAALLLLIGGCGENLPTAPVDSGRSVPRLIPDGVALASMLREASDQVVPTLPQEHGRGGLVVSLAHLIRVIPVADTSQVRLALIAARGSVSAYGAAIREADVLADLDVITLSLDAIERALTPGGKQ